MEPEFSWSLKFGQIAENSYDMYIPPDITFKILENGVEYEIKAHKMLIGVVSPVFHRTFFVSDTQDRHTKKLLIKGTTRGAFTTMKNAIYGTKSMKDGLKDKSVDEVFAILDLVTRYQIPELVKVVQSHLASFPLTRDNVLDVFTVAIENISTFEKEAQELLLLCARFKDKSVHDVFAILDAITRNPIPEVREVVGNNLHFITLTLDTVLEVASVAREQSSTFEKEAQQLMVRCAEFLHLKGVLSYSVESLHDFLGDNLENSDIFRDLLELMDTKETDKNVTQMLKTLRNYQGSSVSPFRVPLECPSCGAGGLTVKLRSPREVFVHNTTSEHMEGRGVGYYNPETLLTYGATWI